MYSDCEGITLKKVHMDQKDYAPPPTKKILLERKKKTNPEKTKQTGKDEVGKSVYLQHSNTQKNYFL